MRPHNARNLFLVVLSLIISILITRSYNVKNQNGHAYTDPEVFAPQGHIRGVNIVTNHKRVIHGFKGIPFAQPPIGNLRFRAPLAAAGWTGTLNAIKDPSTCPQIFKGKVLGEEDCLYLNVYTPQLPSNGFKLLPVMVWIHGGAFCRGFSSDASPEYILDKDVLLVVPSYRIGPLGFLSTGDEVSPGNYGLKDQVLALEWVRDNINYFGGDPNQVTIFGFSAGAASVNLLALSDLAAGLFHKYIKISGSALSPRAYAPRSVLTRHSYLLGEHLGCPISTSTVLINCLRELNALQIVNTTSLFVKWDKYPDMVWRPTDEPPGEGAFLADSPANLYATRKIRDLPCISGSVRDEGLYFTKPFYENPDLFDDFLTKIDDVLPYILLYEDREDVSSYTAALKSFYLKDLTADKTMLLGNLTQLISDVHYIYPIYSAHVKQFSLGKSPQYLYSFEYLRTFKHSIDSAVANGIQHGDDEIFVFPMLKMLKCNIGLFSCKMSGTDYRMVDVMVGLWTSFAINGTPTSTSSSVLTWEKYSTQDNYLTIGNGSNVKLEVKYSFLKERMQFWDNMAMSGP